jgi:protein-arginine kinase
MTRDERREAIQEMDRVIERAERACQSYELMHMEMMATLARAKAIHKQLIAKKMELEKELQEGE